MPPRHAQAFIPRIAVPLECLSNCDFPIMAVPLASPLLVVVHPTPRAHGRGLRPNPLEN